MRPWPHHSRAPPRARTRLACARRDGNANCKVRKEGDKQKDGYAAGEAARGSKHSGSSGSRDYGFNQLDNGQFEIVFSKPFCSVYFNAGGRLDRTSPDCTDDQIDRARKAASRGY